MKKILFTIIIILFSISFAYPDDSLNLSVFLEKARQGDTEAMCDLGEAYYNGKGTLKDPFKAKCWIKMAYNNGSKRAETLWNDMELWNYSGKCEASFDDEKRPKHKNGQTFIDPVLNITFVYLQKDCFIMGCHDQADKCRKDERPSHEVCIDGFWMGKFEVTQDQWQQIMGSNPSRFSNDQKRPVENVSYPDVIKFIRLLNAKSRYQYSLPTEAQWEYACRNNGEKVNYPWGNESWRPEENCGSCDSGEYQFETAPVGSFGPNALGLYDMAGNVKEWCLDYYDKKAYSNHESKNPIYAEKESTRVIRGGSYSDNVTHLRCTARSQSIDNMRSDNVGFRLVLNQLPRL